MKTPHKKIPLRILIEFAGLMLRHEETRNAIVAMHEFLALPDKQGSSDPRYPIKADTLLSDFMGWFTLKTGVGPNDWGYIKHGQILADSVASGQFTTVDAADAIDNLKHASGFAQYIEV